MVRVVTPVPLTVIVAVRCVVLELAVTWTFIFALFEPDSEDDSDKTVHQF